MITATEVRGLKTGGEPQGSPSGSIPRRRRSRQRLHRRQRNRNWSRSRGSGPGQDPVAGIGQRE
jgi:hypothetical protein